MPLKVIGAGLPRTGTHSLKIALEKDLGFSRCWEPLCALLGVPVPDAPFPISNTSDETQALMRAMLEGTIKPG